MKFTSICISLLLLAASSSQAAGDLWSEGPDLSKVKPGFYGGDGTSQKRAVIAVGLHYSAPRWIAQKYPGSKIEDVSLVIPPGKKRYDVYRLKKHDGKTVDVWFQLLGGLRSGSCRGLIFTFDMGLAQIRRCYGVYDTGYQ